MFHAITGKDVDPNAIHPFLELFLDQYRSMNCLIVCRSGTMLSPQSARHSVHDAALGQRG
jgi:hypothetical protein